MNLRIARKIGKASTRGPLRLRDNETGHNPEQRRRAALRMRRNWWRHSNYSVGTTKAAGRDWRVSNVLMHRERRRHNWARNERRRAAGLPEAFEDRAGFWPFDPWPPDGVRAAFALRGEPWLPSWLAATAKHGPV